MSRSPRWFGRARHLTRKKRLMEVVWDTLYRGAWPSYLARPLGLQGRLVVDRHELTVRAPAGRPLPPLRVAFASDFHAGPATHPATVVAACRALEEADADLVLLGGDYVSFHARHVDRLAPLLARVPARLGKLAVLGNHDLVGDDAYIVDRLASAGVRTLINEHVRLPAPWNAVVVCGLDNPEEGEPDAERAFAGTDGAADVRLVLMHSPDGLAAVGARPFALAFCGHVHGGQFYLRGRSLIRHKGPLSQRHVRGGHVTLDAARQLLVSRGIGQGNLPMRRGANPQVHLCTVTFVGS